MARNEKHTDSLAIFTSLITHSYKQLTRACGSLLLNAYGARMARLVWLLARNASITAILILLIRSGRIHVHFHASSWLL